MLMLSVLQVATAAFLLDGTAGLSFGFLNGGSSFFEPIEVGFRAKAKLLGVDTIHSRVSSSSKCNEEKSEFVREFIELGVDGIAMKPCSLTEGFEYLDIAEKAGIPIIMFDSDVANSTRKAYIGTENEFMGRTMARLLRQLRPEGGTYAIVAPKVGRLEGFVEEITKNNDRKNKAHWHEVHRDFPLSISGTNLTYMDQMELYALENPTAIITMKQTPMKHPNWTQFVDQHRHQNITYVGSDGSPLQLDYLDRRYVDGLVGQLPYEIGSDAAKLLYDIVAKDKMPEKEIYHTNLVAYNLIPKDLPPLQLDENLIGKSKYVGYTCFGIIALSCLACVAWTLHNSNRVVVRAAQPFFLLMVAAGVLVISGSLIPLSMDDGGEPEAMSHSEAVGICMSIPWLSFTGFTVAFSALFSKTWRVNRLFRASEHISRMKIEVKDTLAPMAALLLGNFIVLICWTVFDPLTYVRELDEGTDFWNREIASYGVCRSDRVVPYLVPLGLLNVSVLGIACWQAFQTREMKSEFSEAKYIALTVSSMAQAFMSGIPILVIVRDMPEVFYLILTFMIFFLCMVMLSLIFLPKVFMQINYDGMDPAQQRRRLMSRQVKDGSARFDSDIYRSSNSMMKAKNDKSGGLVAVQEFDRPVAASAVSGPIIVDSIGSSKTSTGNYTDS